MKKDGRCSMYESRFAKEYYTKRFIVYAAPIAPVMKRGSLMHCGVSSWLIN